MYNIHITNNISVFFFLYIELMVVLYNLIQDRMRNLAFRRIGGS